MIKIIHTCDIKKILKFNMQQKDSYFFITLENKSSKNNELLELKNIKEIKVEEINNTERIQCEKEYISNISNLSLKFHSIDWWANPVSEKNEHVSSLYKNLSTFYTLIETLKKYDGGNKTIFIVCNKEIFEQLKDYCNKNKIEIVSLENNTLIWIKEIKQLFNCSLRLFLFILRVIIQKTFIIYKLGARVRRELKSGKKFYVIRTWIDDRFLEKNGSYRDAYFGKLPEYVIGQGHNLLILGGILKSYLKIVSRIKGVEQIPIIPEEFFLSFSDILPLFFHCHFKKIKTNKEILFNGLNVTKLYDNEITKGYYDAEYRKNILRYYISRNFAKTVNFNIYIQTFENYAWEKVMILGLREGTPNAKLLGFQHAFISRNSFKYFPGREEVNIMPFPDRIITMGEVTKGIMERYGKFKKDIFKTGCALRQEYLSSLVPFKRKRFNKVVVPLTMVKDESLSVMNFLYDSGIAHSGIKVVVRCHPAAPFESFSKELDFIMPDNFLVSNEKTVKDELSDTDMVLYTWTTVAVEALKMGVPIIYIDVLKPMFVDPLFECSSLKRSVSKPNKLLSTIESIYKMDDEEFYSEQKAAQEYLEDYFKPVTDDILKSAFVQG